MKMNIHGVKVKIINSKEIMPMIDSKLGGPMPRKYVIIKLRFKEFR